MTFPAPPRITVRGRWLFVRDRGSLNIWLSSQAYPNGLVLPGSVGYLLAIGNTVEQITNPVQAAHWLTRGLLRKRA